MSTSALITGASGGIGAELACSLARRYSLLFLVGRDRTKLENVAQKITGTRVLFFVGNLTDPAFIAEVANSVDQAGGLDLLVNNAGVSLFGEYDTQPNESIQTLVMVNLVAPMLLSKALLPVLKRRQSQVVNVGSAFGSIGYPGFSAYSATKFGLHGWSQALSRELADSSVRVRVFSPRATLTEMNNQKVLALNEKLKVKQDDPKWVAQEFVRFLDGNTTHYQVGYPERFFAWLNSLAPRLVSSSLEAKLPIIRSYF